MCLIRDAFDTCVDTKKQSSYSVTKSKIRETRYSTTANLVEFNFFIYLRISEIFKFKIRNRQDKCVHLFSTIPIFYKEIQEF